MKKSRGFTYLDTLIALAVLAVLILFLLPGASHINKSYQMMNRREALYRKAENAMEEIMAGRDYTSIEGIIVKISPLGEKEKVEIYDEEENLLLESIRDSRLYTP